MDSNFRAVITASACAFNIGMLSWWAQPIIVHSLIEGMALSESQAGLAISTEIMAVAIVSFVVSSQLHKLPIRKTCLIACIIAVCSHILSAFAGQYEWLLLARLCAGIAEGFVYSIAIGIVASTINPDRGYGIINAVNIVYCSIFMALVPSITLSKPNVVMFVSLAIASVILIPFVRKLPEYVSTSTDNSGENTHGFNRSAWSMLLAMFLWGTGINTLWPYLFYIGSSTDLEVAEVGFTLGSAGFAAFAGVILMTTIGNRFGHLIPLFAGFSVNLLAVLLVTQAPTATTYIVGVMLLMLAVYFILPFLLAISAEADPTGRVAAATGGMYMFTGGIGPVIGGNLVSGIGAEGIGLVFIGECLLTMLLVWKVVQFDKNSTSNNKQEKSS